MKSQESSPAACTVRATPSQTRCMLTPSAVAGAAAASRICSRVISSSVRPAPPSSSGTIAVR
nr:hypothetical protein DA06_03355 [Georgenia sp. SUBG003]